MAQNYKVKLKRWNGIDFDTLNLSSQNVIMNSGQNVETAINNKPSINDNTTTQSNVWSANKTNNQLNIVATNAKPRIASVTLNSTWTSAGNSLYTKTFTIANETITAKTKVDIQQDDTIINVMVNNTIYGMYVLNNNGSLTMCCVGGKPSSSITVQVSLVEVK